MSIAIVGEMGKTLCVIAALVLGACTGVDQLTVVDDHVSALSGWTIEGHIWWNPTPDVQLYLGPRGGSDCHVLAGGARATFNGAPVDLDPGGTTTDPDTGRPSCVTPMVAFPLPATPQADAPFDLVISDDTATVHLGLVNAIAPRAVTLDGGGSLVPGTTATIRWTPSTDDLESTTRGGNDISMYCTPPIFPTLDTGDGSLVRSGNAFSFAVPSTNNQHYTLSCYLDTIVYATVSACDLASCKVELRLPGAYDFPFQLTI